MIDLDRRTVTIGAVTLRPRRIEFDIIAYLAAHPGFVRTRWQILDAVGLSHNSNDRAVDTHVKRIRAHGISAIKTSPSVGYYWEDT